MTRLNARNKQNNALVREMPLMRLALQQRTVHAIKQFQSSNYSQEHDGPRDPEPYHCRFCFTLVRSDAIILVFL
jgi:hypothetical protein